MEHGAGVHHQRHTHRHYNAAGHELGVSWALTARNNVVIDATGCSFNTTEQGVSIADQIAAKVPT